MANSSKQQFGWDWCAGCQCQSSVQLSEINITKAERKKYAKSGYKAQVKEKK